MWKVAALLAIVITPAMAGVFALMPMTFYGINDYAPWLLAAFAGVGALLGLPVSYFVARQVYRLTGGGRGTA